MEVFSFLDIREVKLNKVFSNTQSANMSDVLSTSFRKLGYLFEKKIKAWWDIASFEQYTKSKLVPRRLRWDVPPNDGLTDDESIKEWYQFFNNRGQELIDFLLIRKRKKMLLLDKQISELKSLLEPLQNSPDFLRLSGELKNKMVKWDTEVQEKKRNKFIRDSGDFSRGEVFKWQSRMQTPESAPVTSTQPTSNVPSLVNPRTQKQSSQRRPLPSQGGVPRHFTHPNKRGRGNSSRGAQIGLTTTSIHLPMIIFIEVTTGGLLVPLEVGTLVT